MKNRVNFSHLIAIMVGILIPLIIWGVSVETRFTVVNNNKETINKIELDLREYSRTSDKNFAKILEKLHSIDLSLKDKKDRD